MNNKNIHFPRVRGGGAILFALFALALAGLACQSNILGVPVAITTPTAEAMLVTATWPLEATPSPTPPASSPDTGRVGEICFENVADGTLRVRECPGLGCSEIGILADGDQIAATDERQIVDGSAWLRIDAPIVGWVNARYVCEAAE